MKKKYLAMMLAVGWMFAVSCSGSGGGGTTTETPTASGSGALEVAEQVSVVDAKSTASASVSKSMALKIDFAKAATELASDSAYNTDTTNTHVAERSAETFSRANEILCSIAQTRYVEMVNQGDYKAQIDTTQCSQDKDSAEGAGDSSQNQSSGSNATDDEMWTVNSSRVTGEAHIVKAWIHQKAKDYGGGFSEPAKTIFGRLEITEAADATNPWGIFRIDFRACADTDATCASPMMEGFLKTERNSSGKVLLEFYTGGGDGMNFEQAAVLSKDPTADSGSGKLSVSDIDKYKGGFSNEFNMAYDASYFHRSDGTDAVCLDRSSFNTNVWRYGLYYDELSTTPGARVSVENPAFPIRYTSTSGQVYYGGASYYGLWLPEEAGIASGDTVYKQVFSSSGPPTETPYTLVVARGRLQKHVKQTVTLGDIKDIPLSWNSECGPSGCTDVRVKWTGTQLIKDATRSRATDWMWQDLPAPVPITAFSDNDFSFNFYSESLGGNGRIDLYPTGDKLTPTDFSDKLTPADFSDATNVMFYKVSTVYPGSVSGVPETLACFSQCIDPSQLTTPSGSYYFVNSTFMGGDSSFDNVNQPVAPTALMPGTNYIPYTFNHTTMELAYGGDPLVLTSKTDFPNGIWGGNLIDPANFSALACNWDATKTCSWKAWDLNEFYTWETGANSWNRMVSLKDSGGSYVSFDPPIMLEYDRLKNGVTSKYYLQFNGFGSGLEGIPGKCVDADTGAEVSCFVEGGQDQRHVRWVPEFSLPAGSEVTDVDTVAKYYVKPLDQEQQMVSVGAELCAGLEFPSYELPTSADVIDPGIGTEPTVTNAPAVIGGELQ